MAVPLDAIRAIHNAFRKDIAAIDEAALAAARGGGGTDPVINRYVLLGEVLAWHASGEEEAVFPAMDRVAPLVAEPYERDHRGLDSLFESLHQSASASDALATARVTAALKFHLDIHLNKEEAHLYRIFNERISPQDQGIIVMAMSRKVPQERFPDLAGWLYPLLGPTDRENMTRIWQQALPAPAFSGAKKLIQAAIGEDWEDLVRRIPELNKAGN